MTLCKLQVENTSLLAPPRGPERPAPLPGRCTTRRFFCLHAPERPRIGPAALPQPHAAGVPRALWVTHWPLRLPRDSDWGLLASCSRQARKSGAPFEPGLGQPRAGRVPTIPRTTDRAPAPRFPSLPLTTGRAWGKVSTWTWVVHNTIRAYAALGNFSPKSAPLRRISFHTIQSPSPCDGVLRHTAHVYGGTCRYSAGYWNIAARWVGAGTSMSRAPGATARAPVNYLWSNKRPTADGCADVCKESFRQRGSALPPTSRCPTPSDPKC